MEVSFWYLSNDVPAYVADVLILILMEVSFWLISEEVVANPTETVLILILMEVSFWFGVELAKTYIFNCLNPYSYGSIILIMSLSKEERDMYKRS